MTTGNRSRSPIRALWAAALTAALLLSGCAKKPHAPAPSSTSETGLASEAASEGSAGDGRGSETGPSELAAFVPFAAIIDNERHARPQSGLDKAVIVVEMLAEGGITRYFAVFDKDPGEPIGPVRSARIYFNRLSHLWRLAVAHAGGNRDALADWKAHAKYDIDAIYTNGGAFYRDVSRKAPHNMYTTPDRIEKVLAARGLQATAPSLPLGPVADSEAASGVEVKFPGGDTVAWRGGADGRWQREVGGKADETADGSPIAADDVIVVVAPVRSNPDPWTVGAIDVQWEKAGKAWLFRNGKVTVGTMRFTPTGIEFKDENGRTAGLTAGSLWIEVVPAADDVNVLP